ncbi:NAD(P)-dependent oxidoreductase [Longibaculum muris]|uniref:NAD(P)-dependent oxidoreductase n=1 Tax=Longibaculum muris TaxID=1796628 RepID=UPI0022E31E0A|nr:NAD(P)-dependent oxidoreductase [Longibaculum muris]
MFINHDDMRSLELMEELMRRGYYVSDRLKDMKYADVIYLGAKGMDRKNRLILEHETIVVDDEIIKHLKENCLVFTLIHNEYLIELSKEYHFQYIALLDQENFVEKNSILTAEGLMSYLISHRRMPLYDSQVIVLGYGHCAKPIIDDLIGLKANVKVAVRKRKYQKEIEKKNAQYIAIDQVDLSQCDILINTIPHVVIEKEQLDHIKKNLMIVDIASYPYGIDHHYALSKGINCQILPSIPCKYAYGYAGKMIADEIERKLENA